MRDREKKKGREREKKRKRDDEEGAMSTADTALSISINMAPGPEHRQEPVAPDKIVEGDRAAAAAADADVENVDTTTGSSNNSNSNDSVVAEQSANIEIAPTTNFAAGADSANQSSPSNSGVDSKQVSIATIVGRGIEIAHARNIICETRASFLSFYENLLCVRKTCPEKSLN